MGTVNCYVKISLTLISSHDNTVLMHNGSYMLVKIVICYMLVKN